MSNQFNDLKLEWLETETSEIGSVNDLEQLWLLNNIFPNEESAKVDMWQIFLSMQGFDIGSRQDKQFAWLESLGFDQATLQEKFHAYYSTTP